MAGPRGPLDRALRYRWVISWILACGCVLAYFHRPCAAVLAVDIHRCQVSGVRASPSRLPRASAQPQAKTLAGLIKKRNLKMRISNNE